MRAQSGGEGEGVNRRGQCKGEIDEWEGGRERHKNEVRFSGKHIARECIPVE